MRFLVITILVLFLTSCNYDDNDIKYSYESTPVYTKGYADYFGKYFANRGNYNEVISLNLLTDELMVNSSGQLAGVGQYLYIEDIFLPDGTTYLAEGDYIASKSEEAFTFLPGEKFKVDDFSINTGAYLYYKEKNSNYSTFKFITRGTMHVSIAAGLHTISCDLVLSDSSHVKGSFTAELPHLNSSGDQNSIRQKISISTQQNY